MHAIPLILIPSRAIGVHPRRARRVVRGDLAENLSENLAKIKKWLFKKRAMS